MSLNEPGDPSGRAGWDWREQEFLTGPDGAGEHGAKVGKIGIRDGSVAVGNGPETRLIFSTE